MFATAFAFLLAVLPLAVAPVLANTDAGRPHDMVMSGMSADSGSPCAGMEEKANHSPGKHAQSCLAQCLVAHGAVLPEVPGLDAAWLSPAALPEVSNTCALHADASGIDPPPPRIA
ncbi:MAG: hypothetical protein R3E09_00145 [Novosphingobium sp.]